MARETERALQQGFCSDVMVINLIRKLRKQRDTIVNFVNNILDVIDVDNIDQDICRASEINIYICEVSQQLLIVMSRNFMKWMVPVRGQSRCCDLNMSKK